MNDRCKHCHDWTDERWEKVSAYHEKLAIQHEKKRERKVLSKSSSSSFSGFSFLRILPIPLASIPANVSSHRLVM